MLNQEVHNNCDRSLTGDTDNTEMTEKRREEELHEINMSHGSQEVIVGRFKRGCLMAPKEEVKPMG